MSVHHAAEVPTPRRGVPTIDNVQLLSSSGTDHRIEANVWAVTQRKGMVRSRRRAVCAVTVGMLLVLLLLFVFCPVDDLRFAVLRFYRILFRPTISINKLTDNSNRDGSILCKSIICGRLGNTLFEYSSTIAMAFTSHKKAVITNPEVLQGLLKNPPPLNTGHHQRTLLDRCKKLKLTFDIPIACIRSNPNKLLARKDYFVKGCLQSWKYFDGIFDEVRELVTFNDDIVTQARRLIQVLRNQRPDSSIVGIHVRRGDIVADIYRARGWNLPSPQYFQRAMTYFRNTLNSNVTFAVVSQDPEWCRENLASCDKDVVVMNPNSPEVDMQFLSMTDHLIQSLGTFSWWSAFKLDNPNSTVVYFKDFAANNSHLQRNYCLKDYMLPKWIAMS